MRKFALLAGLAGVSAVNPITRVAELLTGLSKKIETDGKAEAKLFQAYKCWYKQTTAEKTQSNSEAAARIETLTTFIDDVKNGRIEFTTERQDREKELAAIIASMEKAKDLRAQEKADFDAAKDEMTKAINALTEAVSILGEGAPVGSFLVRKFNQRKALELARTELSTSDYKFLANALNMQTPTSTEQKVERKDWEQLNKKATFKNKYTARSGEIQKTLKDMLSTFETNLSDAEKKEADAITSYDKLTGSKQTERDEAEQALLELSDEMGARGMNLEDAETEKSELESQVENDTKYIKEVQESYDAKMAEFKERKRLRTEEVASISEAIGILRSDDARDLFKKSFASQGYFFTQLEKKSDSKVQAALKTVYAAYKKAGVSTQQMEKVTARLSRAVEGVGEVIKAIDEMLAELEVEQSDDELWKEECEDFTMKNQKEALKHSREMDDQTALIARKVARMEELTEKIAEANKSIDNVNAQMKEAHQIRADEHAEFKSSKADDKAAVELIQMAIEALAKFYKDNAAAMEAALVQTVAPGEAPAPPPTTWDAGYGGEKDEHDGVVGILTLIKEDVEKDIATADAAEKLAGKEFVSFMAESCACDEAKCPVPANDICTEDSKIGKLSTQITNFESAHADAEGAKADAEVAHKEAKALLQSTLDALAAKKADCDFIAVNFPVRKDNRQKEVDGLHKAKTILSGGAAEGVEKGYGNAV
jgi:hypothetical protein